MKMLIVDDHQLVRDGMRHVAEQLADAERGETVTVLEVSNHSEACLLYTSDAADE